MSTDVTMQELELETAELLPARETLNCSAAARAQRDQAGQFGLNVARCSGNNILSGIGVSVNGSAFNGGGNLGFGNL